MGKLGSVLGQIVVTEVQGSNGLGGTMIGYIWSAQHRAGSKANDMPQQIRACYASRSSAIEVYYTRNLR